MTLLNDQMILAGIEINYIVVEKTEDIRNL